MIGAIGGYFGTDHNIFIQNTNSFFQGLFLGWSVLSIVLWSSDMLLKLKNHAEIKFKWKLPVTYTSQCIQFIGDQIMIIKLKSKGKLVSDVIDIQRYCNSYLESDYTSRKKLAFQLLAFIGTTLVIRKLEMNCKCMKYE